MAKPTVTRDTVKKHGIRGVVGDLRTVVIGMSYEWHLAGNESAREATNKFAEELEILLQGYERAIRAATTT
jgi:hypothetical protein